jgi:hypothetical protein
MEEYRPDRKEARWKKTGWMEKDRVDGRGE